MFDHAIDALNVFSDRAACGRRPEMHLLPLPPASASTASRFDSDSVQSQPARTRHEHLVVLSVGVYSAS